MKTPEEQALAQGWKPESDWKGPKEQWKSAEQFLEDGEHIVGRVKQRLEKELEESKKEFDERIAKLERTTSSALEFQKKQADKEREDLLAQLNEKKKAAIADNDLEALETVREQIADVKEAKTPEIDPAHVKAAKDFKAKHSVWQGKDWIVENFANGAAGKLMDRGLDPVELYAELDTQIREAFPDRFGKPKRSSSVESDSPAAPSGDKKTVADLPKEAKAALAMIKKKVPGYQDQTYLDDYFGEQSNA